MSWWMWVIVVWCGLAALVGTFWWWVGAGADHVMSDDWRNGRRGL